MLCVCACNRVCKTHVCVRDYPDCPVRTLVIPFCIPFFAGLRAANYSTVSVFDWPVLGGSAPLSAFVWVWGSVVLVWAKWLVTCLTLCR